MKKTILLYLFFMPLLVNAQNDRPRNLPGYDYKNLHFGFTIGLNSMDLGFQRSMNNDLIADLIRIEPGFQVGIVSDLRLSENWNFRFLPGISFGQRNLAFYNDTSKVTEMKIESSYLEFPFIFKYRAERLNNFRPYLIGGLNYRYDMAARKEFEEESNVFLKLQPGDLYLELGLGLDSYLQYFKFSTELKLGIGMMNILVDDVAEGYPQYLNSLNGLKSFIVMLNFHFE